MSKFLLLGITLALVTGAVATPATSAEFSWPPDLAAKLDHIIAVQREARVKYIPGPAGYAHAHVLRTDFDQSLLEAGALPELQALLPALVGIEQTDLRAKFALMAASFARSQIDYIAMRTMYVNVYYPTQAELDAAYLKDKAAGVPGLIPPSTALFAQRRQYSPAIKPEHVNERYRLVLEYYLFAPVNFPHQIGAWGRMVEALGQIAHPATVVTYRELSSTCPWKVEENDCHLLDHVVWGLCDVPSAAALDALAGLKSLNTSIFSHWIKPRSTRKFRWQSTSRFRSLILL